MASNTSKHAFGSKSNIENAKNNGVIDEYDVLFLDNGETGWLDKNGEIVMTTPRTQKAYTLNGTSLGALSSGDTIPAGKSLDEIMAMATQKAIPATYTQPTVTIVNNGGQASGYVETGTSIILKLRAIFNQNDAGALTKLEILKSGTSVGEGTATPYDYSSETIVIGDETITFSAKATYEEGSIKNNNLGQESPDGHILAGSKISTNYNITGQRNMFYGVGVGDLPELTSNNIRALANKKLNPTQGYSFNINVATGQQYIIFAYPATLRDVNQIMYVETNDTGCASNFTKTLTEIADARGGENGLKSYKVYSYKMATPAAANMTFKVTI